MHRSAAAAGVVFVLAAMSPPVARPQDPAPGTFLDLARRTLTGDAAARAASEQLAAAIEKDYAAAHAVWRMADGAVKAALGRALRLDAIERAAIVVRGRVKDTESIQGGVVDYHTLLLHLEGVEVAKAPADERAAIEQDGAVRVLAGTSRDWWLADLVQRDLRTHVGRDRTFVFTPVTRTHAGGAHATGVTIWEYFDLPAAAAACR